MEWHLLGWLLLSDSLISLALLAAVLWLRLLLLLLLRCGWLYRWDLSDGLIVLGEDSGHLEHLSGALAVRGCDDGRVDVLEATVLEEQMRGEGQVVSHSSHSADQVRAGSQVSDLAQVFISVSLLSKRVLSSVTMTNDLDEMSAVRSRDLQLKELTLGGTLD